MGLLFFFFILLQVFTESQYAFAASRSLTKFLPGFEGPLPFELETGYVGVGESEDVQLFYYFIQSERNPEEDPLLLWWTGGPGCSSFSALFYGNWSIEFQGGCRVQWKLAYSALESILMDKDSPVGTGFSYARNNLAKQTGDFKQVHQLHQFLRKWLIDHPNFFSRPVYIGGDSFSGLILPILVQEISYGNEEGIKPLIDLQGYILGNPITVPSLEYKLQIPYVHGMALISDELYESLKRTCEGEYHNVDPSNEDCQKDLQYYDKCVSRIQIAQILEPRCAEASPMPLEMLARRRYLDVHHQELLDPFPPPTVGCRQEKHRINSSVVQGSIGRWQSGDHDMIVPFLATQAWIRALNYPIVDDWRPWMLQGQVAGVSDDSEFSVLPFAFSIL
ncbi:hypothetical protein POUND7_017963 [Theobroma cacao]